jgi:hypothetical protein
MEYFFDPLLMEICSRHGQLLTKVGVSKIIIPQSIEVMLA